MRAKVSGAAEEELFAWQLYLLLKKRCLLIIMSRLQNAHLEFRRNHDWRPRARFLNTRCGWQLPGSEKTDPVPYGCATGKT